MFHWHTVWWQKHVFTLQLKIWWSSNILYCIFLFILLTKFYRTPIFSAYMHWLMWIIMPTSSSMRKNCWLRNIIWLVLWMWWWAYHIIWRCAKYWRVLSVSVQPLMRWSTQKWIIYTGCWYTFIFSISSHVVSVSQFNTQPILLSTIVYFFLQ